MTNLADEVNDAQRNILNRFRNNIDSASNTRKGNFGEMAADLDLSEKGFIPLHRRIDNIDAPGHNGIDGIFEKNGQYFIIEGKFTGSASLNAANPSTGLPRQMSDAWITQGGNQRLVDALEGNRALANRVAANYTRVLAKAAPDGTVTYRLVDEAGFVIRGNAGNFMP